MAAMELTSSGSESKQYRFELAAVEEVVASLPVRGHGRRKASMSDGSYNQFCPVSMVVRPTGAVDIRRFCELTMARPAMTSWIYSRCQPRANELRFSPVLTIEC
jgi:hypothetical protein